MSLRHHALLLTLLLPLACAGPAATRPLAMAESNAVVRLDAWTPTWKVTTSPAGKASKARVKADIGDAAVQHEVAGLASVTWNEGGLQYSLSGQAIDVHQANRVFGASRNVHIQDQTLDLTVGKVAVLSPDDEGRPDITARYLAGIRYRRLDQRVSPFAGFSVSQNDDWVEPMIGAGINVPIDYDLSFDLSADMSGFDVGSGSHRTWSATLRTDYALGESSLISLGWRTWDVEMVRGSGAARYELDGNFSGPFLGFTAAF